MSGSCVCWQDVLPAVVNLEWAMDGASLLYTVPDSHGRPYQVTNHFCR
jgi:hypothetical protein